eukprot:TRINITY_DN6224_c0_g1_i1.p1 TRINITY_DN6224_c0_g1~~TRINITY_DN6224_c0_g1_i1.p1  ORF type:complete len:220 (-),score=24.16 TRINITY_DN6224_c0_g1_i1:183-842(-)
MGDLAKLVRFLDNLNGRDKIARTLQYGAKFLAWYLVASNKAEVSKRFVALETSSAMARKLFRLAKSISLIQSAAKTYKEENDPLIKSTTVVQQLCLALWLAYDHAIWAGKLGLVQTDIAAHSKKSNSFWLVSMIMGVIKNTYLLQQTQRLVAETNKANALESLRKRQVEFILELLRNLFDIPIPLSALSPRLQISPGLVGLSGLFTSFIGIYQVWSRLN